MLFRSYSGVCELLNGDIIKVISVSPQPETQVAPVWTETAGVRKQINIVLTFRNIVFQTEDGGIYERKIIESLLENKNPSLSIDEMKALYINMVMRIKDDKKLTNTKSEEFLKAAASDPYYNALHVKYGYAFTCHKSQGGEWDTVFVDFSKRGGLDTDSLRWKYTAVTRARKQLFQINLSDVTPMANLKINPVMKTTKMSNEALNIKIPAETPYHPAAVPAGVKAKYFSITENMEGTPYSVKSVASKPYRDIYEVNTPDGIVRVDCVYNGAGQFTKFEARPENSEILKIFEDEDNMVYYIDYTPTKESLDTLYRRMMSLCDEFDIVVTNIAEHQAAYNVVYYMKTTGRFAAITFFYDSKGFISYAAPVSEKGAADEKLMNLIEKLK